MKIFTTSIKNLFGKKTWAPTELVFNAQFTFLKKICPEWLESVEKPSEDGKACFHYQFPPHVSIKDFRERIIDGDWGDFKVTDIRIHANGESNWPTARVYIKIK